MIDIHNHMLFGIDDGAQSLRESIELAKAAVANGITHCVCTPHINFGRFDNTPQSIDSAFYALREALVEESIPLKLGRAAEVRFDVEVLAAIEERRIPFLGDWDGRSVVLLEFPSAEIPAGAKRFVELLFDLGVVPLIAHPERNRGMLRHPERLYALLEHGCLLQITAASVVGEFGERAAKLALSLIEANLVTVIATDSHHAKRRPPLMREAFGRVTDLWGRERAISLTVDNPWAIVRRQFS